MQLDKLVILIISDHNLKIEEILTNISNNKTKINLNPTLIIIKSI